MINRQLGLSVAEEAALTQHEETIERGLRTFTEVGTALLSIRDERLYRRQYDTFEDYCEARWQLSRRRAYQLMEAAEVTANVQNFAHSNSPMSPPANDAQARPLAALPADQQPAAWAKAVETAPNGRVTAAHVQSVVDRYKAPAFDPEVEPESVDDWADDAADSDESDPDNLDYGYAPLPPFFTDSAAPPASVAEAQPNRLAPLMSSESPEWYTPADVLARVVSALGTIDLDPCSNSHESPNVPAARHFTREDDGLRQPWAGRVFLNPPYGAGVGEWVERLRFHYLAGLIPAAIALLPARTDTRWWRVLAGFPVCFIRGRLKFSGHAQSAPFPSAAVYLGPDLPAFRAAFRDTGTLYTPEVAS